LLRLVKNNQPLLSKLLTLQEPIRNKMMHRLLSKRTSKCPRLLKATRKCLQLLKIPHQSKRRSSSQLPNQVHTSPNQMMKPISRDPQSKL
jgi:hypothetical protein